MVSDETGSDKPILSQEDVVRLMKNPTSKARIETAEKVAGAFSADNLSGQELPIAQEILWVLAKDAEVKVRAALSRELAHAKNLPSDMAMHLARDIDDVALPVLSFSEVFDDGELIQLISEADVNRNVAIAGRETVSEGVATALVETGNENVVARLVSNEGADLTEPLLLRVVEDFPNSEAVHAPLVRRDVLPISVSERLVALVSDRLKEHLVRKHALPEDAATDLVIQSRERATLGLLGESGGENALDLAREMHRNGRLNESILTRAAATGDMAFVDASLAVLADIPIENARTLIHEAGTRGLQSLYDKTGLPKRSYVFLRKAIDLYDEGELDGEEHDLERFQIRLLERALTGFEVGKSGIDEADEMYLVRRIETLTQETSGSVG